MKTELKRALFFLLIMAFYFTTEIGLVIGLLHLILILVNPKKFGMSRIMLKLVPPAKALNFNN